MNKSHLLILFLLILISPCLGSKCPLNAQEENKQHVTRDIMQQIYNEIKTPYKYGIVFKHPDSTKLVDCPTIYRKKGMWYMTYIVFDGKGYETWLAQSKDLLRWKGIGRILSFTEGTWDANQKAGYMSLVDINWGGTYNVGRIDGKYWMSYLGGSSSGYEAGVLRIGLANSNSVTKPGNWEMVKMPVLNPRDPDGRWFESSTIYKIL